MAFKVTKLDRRYAGHQWFKYMVEPEQWPIGKDGAISKFKEIRAWMWDAFGPGCELDFVQLQSTGTGLESVETWCWRTNSEGERKLYFKSDREFSVFTLKWL
jgi:hypothetical protein